MGSSCAEGAIVHKVHRVASKGSWNAIMRGGGGGQGKMKARWFRKYNQQSKEIKAAVAENDAIFSLSFSLLTRCEKSELSRVQSKKKRDSNVKIVDDFLTKVIFFTKLTLCSVLTNVFIFGKKATRICPRPDRTRQVVLAYVFAMMVLEICCYKRQQ